jgi:hypothetical protein
MAATAALAGLLAACQTAGTPLTDTAKASLAATGFTKIDLPAGTPVPGGVGVDGIYICPKEKCGTLVMVMMATLAPGAQQSAVTLEEMISSGAVKADTIKAIFKLGVERSPSASKPENYTVTVNRVPASFTVRGNGRVSSGKQAFFTAVFRVTGNSGRGIMAFSDSKAVSERFARPAWIN